MNALPDFIAELRRQARLDYDLTNPYSAGIAAGLAMAATQLQLHLHARGPRVEWQVSNWGSRPVHPVWIPRPTYAQLFRDVCECVLELTSVDIVAPGLVRIDAIDTDAAGNEVPVEIVLEEVTR